MTQSSLHELQKLSEKYQDEMVTFLQELVQIPSVNGRDTEKAVAERIAAEGQKLGFNSRLVAKDPERPNAFVGYGDGENGFAITDRLQWKRFKEAYAWIYWRDLPVLVGHLLR